MPVILRNMGTSADPYFYFIGEAYVHGMMEGEALPKESPEYPYGDYDYFRIR